MPQVNCQFYEDEETLRSYAKCARIFASLADYKKKLMIDASEKGHPLIRHMFLHFHQDSTVWNLNQQVSVNSKNRVHI
jgi:alpha-glucosidase (family GH31 glycosyl hydrolase)